MVTVDKLELEIKELRAQLAQDEMNKTLIGLLRKENSYLKSILKGEASNTKEFKKNEGFVEEVADENLELEESKAYSTNKSSVFVKQAKNINEGNNQFVLSKFNSGGDSSKNTGLSSDDGNISLQVIKTVFRGVSEADHFFSIYFNLRNTRSKAKRSLRVEVIENGGKGISVYFYFFFRGSNQE